jgi:hypothetical protein
VNLDEFYNELAALNEEWIILDCIGVIETKNTRTCPIVTLYNKKHNLTDEAAFGNDQFTEAGQLLDLNWFDIINIVDAADDDGNASKIRAKLIEILKPKLT